MDKIERAIAKVLVPTLKAQGFELHKNWGFFVRPQSYGFDALMVVNQGTASGKYFEINVYAEVRHDCIEIPWNTFGFVYNLDEAQEQTGTLMLRRPPAEPILKVFPASMEADIATVAREVEAFFVTTSLPFYQRFAELREVERLVNEKPLAELMPYSAGGPLDHLAMRSLLLAKAVNPTRYASVREAFLKSEKKTLFPREQCLEMVKRIDEMVIQGN